MNPLPINKTRLTFWLIMATLIFTTLGCNSDNELGSINSQDHEKVTITEAEPVKPKTPKIDIHTAVLSDNIEAIQMHILAGTDINQKDPFGGSSPLISAALFDKQKIVTLLLDAGADINFQNNDGATALHVSAFFCRPEIVQLLLDKAADKTIQNNSGSTAYDSVSGSFQDVKPIYDMLGQSLAPMGLTLDYDYLKATRPQIAAMLK